MLCGRNESDRGQSETIGSILLVGVGVVLVAVVAVLGLGLVDDQTSDPTTASVESELSEQSLSVTHTAGDPLLLAETEVVIRGDGFEDRIPLESMVPVTSDGDDQFTSGETFSVSHAAQGEVQVLVVHEPSEAVVHDRTYDLSGEFVSRLARFDENPPETWGGNRSPYGTTTVRDGGQTVNITGNQWKTVDFDYTVTEDTVIAFEFRTDQVGQIHGIGFESDTNQESGRVVRVAGSQGWGVSVASGNYGPYYSAGDGWVRYEVPIGEIYADNGKLGDASSLLFVNDCDGCNARSAFRNVRVYESDD